MLIVVTRTLRVHTTSPKIERQLREARNLLEAAKRLERDGGRESDRRLWRKNVVILPDLTAVSVGVREEVPPESPFQAEYFMSVARRPGREPTDPDLALLYPPAIEELHPSGAAMARLLYAAVRTIIRGALRRHAAVELRDGKIVPVPIGEDGEQLFELAKLLEQAEDGTAPPSAHKCLAQSCERTLEGARRPSRRQYCSQKCQKREWRAQIRSGRR